MKALAVTSAALAWAPELPTMAEAGYGGATLTFGLLAPAQRPP